MPEKDFIDQIEQQRKNMNVLFERLIFETITTALTTIFNKKDIEGNPNLVKFQINESLEQFRVDFWKHTIAKQEDFNITYIPKTWKDHFKRHFRTRWWMKLWIRRKPIQYLPLRRITIFPEVKVPDSDEHFKEKVIYYQEIKENEKNVGNR